MAWWYQWLCPWHLEHEVEMHPLQARKKQEDTGQNQDQFYPSEANHLWVTFIQASLLKGSTVFRIVQQAWEEVLKT